MQMIPESYLYDCIESFFNEIVNNCICISNPMHKTLERDIFKNIIGIQYQAKNRTVFIETETFNYVLSEGDGTLKLCEFYIREDMENKVKG